MANDEEQGLRIYFAERKVEMPKVIHHLVCGQDVFLYFGPIEDAKMLKDFNCLADMEGCHLTPKNMYKCAHCEQRIRPDNIAVSDPNNPANFPTIPVKRESYYSVLNDTYSSYLRGYRGIDPKDWST